MEEKLPPPLTRLTPLSCQAKRGTKKKRSLPYPESITCHPTPVAESVVVGRRRHVVGWKRTPASRLVGQPAQDGTERTGQCPRLQKGQKSEFLRVAPVMWTSEASRAQLTRIGALSSPAAVTGSAHNRIPPSPYFPIQQSSWMVDTVT